jgi:23S rRNA pseudouridine1911/1915/1917 synthase
VSRRVLTATPGRLDVVVATLLGLARADVQRAVGEGRVVVDGRPRAKSFRLHGGERVEVDLPDVADLQPEREPVPIRYRDQHLAVVSKPAGLVTHPTPARRTGTLVNRLLGMGLPLAPGPEPDRPGIVHRLDAGTSGLMVVALSEPARADLASMFRRHAVDRRYLALIRGRPPHDEFLIEAPLERRGARIRLGPVMGKEAATRVRVVERMERSSLVEARPLTGRTHQIRVHLSSVGHPILGDRAYGGGGDDATRLGLAHPFLHSWWIGFDHPITGKWIEVTESLPDELDSVLRQEKMGQRA